MLYDSSLILLDERCVICTGEPYFVSREMGDMLKDRGLDNLTVVDTSKINNFPLN